MTYIEERQAKLAKIRAALEEKNAPELETRANESMSTGQDWYGQDFVPTDLASTVISTIRDSGNLFSKLPAPILMPSSSYTIPVEGGDPTWYATSENANVAGTDVTKSKAGTDDITLVAKKYSMSTYFTGELDDDSIVNIRSYLATKLSQSYNELIDKIIMHGDTETGATGNVNSDDGAPTAGTYYLHQDGLFKKSIVTATNTINAGTLDLGDIRDARKALGTKGIDPSKLLLVVDNSVYFKLLGLTQVETMEKFGNAATVLNGRIIAIDGVEILPLSYVGKAEADGKLSTTANNNSLGRAVLIYKPDVLTGFKRNLQTFTEFLPRTDQFCLTAHVRFAVKVLASDSCCVLRNITV